MNNENKIYCGIDVSKKELEVYVQGKSSTFANSIDGIIKLMAFAGEVHFVLESTGGYERLAAWTLMKDGMTVSIVNPARVREFAKGTGQLAKTDKIDAQILEHYARVVSPRETELPSESQRKLTVLMDRRQQLLDMHTAENNRLETAGETLLQNMILEHIRWLKKKIESTEKEIMQTIQDNEDMREKHRRIKTIKGLGDISAVTILVCLPELGTLSRKEIAALAGLAPYNKDSGTFKGYRHIRGGRGRLRACLYMAALAAVRYNPVLKEFYNRLIEVNKKKKKVALIAVMRKLVIAANSIVKNPEISLAI